MIPRWRFLAALLIDRATSAGAVRVNQQHADVSSHHDNSTRSATFDQGRHAPEDARAALGPAAQWQESTPAAALLVGVIATAICATVWCPRPRQSGAPGVPPLVLPGSEEDNTTGKNKSHVKFSVRSSSSSSSRSSGSSDHKKHHKKDGKKHKKGKREAGQRKEGEEEQKDEGGGRKTKDWVKEEPEGSKVVEGMSKRERRRKEEALKKERGKEAADATSGSRSSPLEPAQPRPRGPTPVNTVGGSERDSVWVEAPPADSRVLSAAEPDRVTRGELSGEAADAKSDSRSPPRERAQPRPRGPTRVNTVGGSERDSVAVFAGATGELRNKLQKLHTRATLRPEPVEEDEDEEQEEEEAEEDIGASGTVGLALLKATRALSQRDRAASASKSPSPATSPRGVRMASSEHCGSRRTPASDPAAEKDGPKGDRRVTPQELPHVESAGGHARKTDELFAGADGELRSKLHRMHTKAGEGGVGSKTAICSGQDFDEDLRPHDPSGTV